MNTLNIETIENEINKQISYSESLYAFTTNYCTFSDDYSYYNVEKELYALLEEKGINIKEISEIDLYQYCLENFIIKKIHQYSRIDNENFFYITMHSIGEYQITLDLDLDQKDIDHLNYETDYLFKKEGTQIYSYVQSEYSFSVYLDIEKLLNFFLKYTKE